jgi:glycerol uptake facilitator protein
MKTSQTGEFLAEFFGTMMILLIGCGVNSMVTLFGTGAPGEIVKGGYTHITLGWGLAVTFGVYVAGRISGGHLNPAVTVALAIFRDFPWGKVAPYVVAQTLGAFAGAALVFFNYRVSFAVFDPTLEKTAGIFTTFPLYPEIPAAGFFDQVLGTAILLFLVFAITDARNQMPDANLTPVLIGLIVVAIGMSFGSLHGYAINPARDFGPRVFVTMAGFKNAGFATPLWLVPIAAPLLGGVIGAGLYDLAVRRYLPE